MYTDTHIAVSVDENVFHQRSSSSVEVNSTTSLYYSGIDMDKWRNTLTSVWPIGKELGYFMYEVYKVLNK